MKNRRFPSVAHLLIVIQFCFAVPSRITQAFSTDDSVFEKTFSQRFSAIAIENASGRTDIETWNSNRVKVTASPQPGKLLSAPLESRIRFQINETDLRIVIRGEKTDEPINLMVFVPRQVNLAVKGDTEAIAVRGITNALTVETESGGISLFLPRAANTDLSLRSIEGTITSQLEMRVFGPVNAHSLDGRTGRGGAPVILRSMRGPVSLLTEEPGRIARADARAANDMDRADTPPVMNASSIVSTNTTSGNTADTESVGSVPSAPAVGATNPLDPPVADIIKIDTRLVNLNVRVTDHSGKLLPDLSKADFQIFEDSVEQEVVRFEPVNFPVSVVLCLMRVEVQKSAGK
jgi:hypothetical protein